MCRKASDCFNPALSPNMTRASMNTDSSRWTRPRISRRNKPRCANSSHRRWCTINRNGARMGNAHQYFGDGLPYVNLSDLKGKLIAIEGTDGVGRSTHIDLLQEWLEVQGYGVITTGWTRSNLMSKTIEMAKQGNILDRWSFSLLYATDFAD